MTPRVNAFVAANDASPATQARVLCKLRGGVEYTLASGSVHTLDNVECGYLPAGYPKWQAGENFVGREN